MRYNGGMQKLVELLSAQDLEKIFEQIHTAVALVEKDGAFLSWNSAFEPYKNLLGNVFPQKLSERHWVEEFLLEGMDVATFCNCALLPASNGRFLLVAEPITSESASKHGIEKLNKKVKLFQLESEFSKKLAHNKQVELEAVIAQAKEVSHTDPLTFLLNRRAMLQEIQDEVVRAERYKSLLSVSVVDVDHFKLVNDNFGHPVGDDVLKRVARMLRDS